MKSTILLPILITLISITFSAHKITAQQMPVKESISFCDLVKDPERYNLQKVTVRATYRYGFEWQEIYCLECRNLGKTWLEIGDLTRKSERVLKKFPKDDGTITALFTGVFQSSSGPFGDGGYRFRFVLTKISEAELVSKSGGDPRGLPDKLRKKLCNK